MNDARFTTHEKKTLSPYLLQDRFERVFDAQHSQVARFLLAVLL